MRDRSERERALRDVLNDTLLEGSDGTVVVRPGPFAVVALIHSWRWPILGLLAGSGALIVQGWVRGRPLFAIFGVLLAWLALAIFISRFVMSLVRQAHAIFWLMVPRNGDALIRTGNPGAARLMGQRGWLPVRVDPEGGLVVGTMGAATPGGIRLREMGARVQIECSGSLRVVRVHVLVGGESIELRALGRLRGGGPGAS